MEWRRLNQPDFLMTIAIRRRVGALSVPIRPENGAVPQPGRRTALTVYGFKASRIPSQACRNAVSTGGVLRIALSRTKSWIIPS